MNFLLNKVSKMEGKSILLPKDSVVSDKFNKDVTSKIIPFDQMLEIG